jgi:N-acetylneuraminic acid mutarotase
MNSAVGARRIARRAVPAGLLALSLMLEGCDERQESPLGPSETRTEAAAGIAGLRGEKEHSAADLGPPPASARGILAARLVSALGATTTSIPFAPEPGPFANAVPPCDDCMFNGLPIGFSFTFFGNSYTTFNLSTNGFIGFTPGTDNGCCSGRTIPAADGLNNIIAAAWTDLYPPGGGGVFYETRGRAPSRYLIVAYPGVPWCCGSGNHVTTQIILYEGSNAIEIHTANQSAGHIYTQGVEDATGTQAAFVVGRVAANYGLANDAVRFTTAQGSWTARRALSSGRRGPAVAVASGLLYAIGGENSAGTVLSSVVAYSPSTNAWSTRAPLPAARLGNGAAAIGNTLYVPAGRDAAGALTRSLYAYNATTNTWRSRASLPRAVGCGGSAVISGKLYVFSGCTRSSTGAQVAAGLLHRYDPSTNLWTELRSAPEPHFQPAVGAISGRLYVVGGNNGAGVAIGRLDVYDPATNMWTTRAAMPTSRVAAAGVVAGGKLHVIGGRNGTTYLNTVQAYNPATNSWVVEATMPTARAAFGAGAISNLIYAIGGRNVTNSLTANERYTP